MNYTSIGDVLFAVSDEGALMTMRNSGAARDIVIPRKLPNGIEIVSISRIFCYGAFTKVTISDEISTISPYAFLHSYVDSVVWPASCYRIPESCFRNSRIKSISNIEHVTEIAKTAFHESHIKSFSWPSECLKIPYMCFSSSHLETISNVDSVWSIDSLAFSDLKCLQSLDLSSSVVSLISQSAFYKTAKDKILLPYYIPDEELDNAFHSPPSDCD